LFLGQRNWRGGIIIQNICLWVEIDQVKLGFSGPKFPNGDFLDDTQERGVIQNPSPQHLAKLERMRGPFGTFTELYVYFNPFACGCLPGLLQCLPTIELLANDRFAVVKAKYCN
jgi:hypothetical protein